MLKRRIAATIIVKNNIAVQSILFEKYLPLGKPEIAVEFLNKWGVDEIIVLDISKSKHNLPPDFEMIKTISNKCFVPLTVGGGVCSLGHINELMHSGADKVSLNQVVFKNPKFITEASLVFGNQCIVVSLDILKTSNGYTIYDYLNRSIKKLNLNEFLKEIQDRGAGEIYLNSVNRDGTYMGFDVELIKEVCNNVSIPVICSGGAKNATDFKNIFLHSKVSAASAANFFHFKEHSVTITKSIVNKTIPLRMETHTNYNGSTFDENCNLEKKPDIILEEMLFQKIESETI